MDRGGEFVPEHTFRGYHDATDVHGMIFAITSIQNLCISSRAIHFNYEEIFQRIPF